MIVGTKDIPYDKLRSSCYSVSSLKAFSVSLVPRPFRHIESIVDNQKYLVAITVRNITTIPYKKRKELCEGLLQGISVTGIVNYLFDISDLLVEVDTEMLYTYLFREEEK